jgi:hypothetical protein
MAEPDENFAIKLTDDCKTREQWLAVINFGRAELLRKPGLLMELIVRRAQQEQFEQPANEFSKDVPAFAAELLRILNLEFC